MREPTSNFSYLITKCDKSQNPYLYNYISPCSVIIAHESFQPNIIKIEIKKLVGYKNKGKFFTPTFTSYRYFIPQIINPSLLFRIHPNI